MTAQLFAINTHPTKVDITLHNETIQWGSDPIDLIGDLSLTDEQAVASLLTGELNALIHAGFIALTDPLTDIATLTLTQDQLNFLFSQRILGPFRAQNQKTQAFKFNANGELITASVAEATNEILTSIDGYSLDINTNLGVINTTLNTIHSDGYRQIKGDNDISVSAVTVDADHRALEVHLATLISGEIQNSNCLNVIEFEHQQIHEGKHYVTSIATPELDTASYYVRIATPDTSTRIHMVFEVSTNVGTKIEIFENPTVDVAGTAYTPLNNDRNSANVSALTITYGDTSTADGTLIHGEMIGSSGGPTRIGGSGGRDCEFILKQNEEYFIKVTTLVNDGFCYINLSWYEV